jgi:fructokinase
VCSSDIPLIFGEVLFDCFPDGREVLGGAPFNVAWNLQALGLSPLLVSKVGDDFLGRRIQETMHSWGMDCQGLQVEPSHPTGRVHIDLANGEPEFTILADQAYDYISKPGFDLKVNPAFLYHGSLALRNNTSFNTLAQLKQQYKCPVFVDVNLRTPWWNNEQVLAIIKEASWLKLNDVELDTLFPGSENLEIRCRNLLERFDLEGVFVTLAEKGAAALNRDNIFSSTKPPENISTIDTVGAGDAFSSVLLLGTIKNWPLDITLQRAQDLAAAVVGQRGAISNDRQFYKTFKNNWNLQ